MIITFGNRLARDLVEQRASKEMRAFPQQLVRNARKKLAAIHAAKDIQDLAVPPGNRLEKLRGDRAGFHSIRINVQYRIVFRFENSNAYEVSVEDYHT